MLVYSKDFDVLACNMSCVMRTGQKQRRRSAGGLIWCLFSHMQKADFLLMQLRMIPWKP